MVMADELAAMPVLEGGSPLVLADLVLNRSTAPQPGATPGEVWPRYLLASLAVIFAAALVGRLLPPAALARAWFVLGGVAGLVLLFFWFGTDHAVARLNLNVLVLNPLLFVFVARGRAARYALPVVAMLAALSVAWTGLPPAQYTADVLAALLPLNIAAAWSVSRAARAGRWPGRA